MRRWLQPTFSGVLAVLIGCQSGVPGLTPATKAPRSGAKAEGANAGGLPRSSAPVSVVADQAGAQAPLPGPGLIGNHGGGVVSNNGASLFGRLKAPATLISDQGGSLISDQGGSMFGKTKFYRVAQAGPVLQYYLPNTRVELRDAGGAPVIDGAGKPLVTQTDASGTFRFDAELPASNLIVSAPLANGLGAIQAVATRDARSTALEADLFSTLTTAYIIGKFVASQPDRQKTLDRLPGDVAMETRHAAEAAFIQSSTQVPGRLDNATSLATTESLRSQVATFDQQMEKVKRLLIAAGQSNLGEGRPATTVSLGLLDDLAEGPDGTLYFPENRLWRVGADGLLAALAGGGSVPAAEADGKAAADLSLEGLDGWCFDDEGRLCLGVDGQLLRIERAGRVTLVGTIPKVEAPPSNGFRNAPVAPKLVAVRQDDVLLERSYTWSPTASLWRYKPGHPPTEVAKVEVPAGLHMNVFRYVPGRGVLVAFDTHTEAPVEFRWIDPDTGAVSPWRPTLPAGVSVEVDRRGNLIYTTGEPDFRLRVWPLGAAAPVAFDAWSGSSSTFIGAGELARDGKSVLITTGPLRPYQGNDTGHQILRVTAAGVTRVAGLAPDGRIGGNATDLALVDPKTVTVDRDGSVWLTDRGGRLLRVDTAGKVHEVVLTDPVFQGTTPFNLDFPNMHPGPAGSVYMYARREGGAGIWLVRKDGSSERLYTPPADYALTSFAPKPNGALLVLLTAWKKPHQLVERAPEGTTRTLFEARYETVEIPIPDREPVLSPRHTPDLTGCDIAPTASGTVWLYGARRIATWDAAGGFRTLRQADHYMRPEDQNAGGVRSAMTLGPDGALYFTPGDDGDGSWNEVRRWDPVTGVEAHIAGRPGIIFKGGSVDETVLDPHSPAFAPSGELLFIDAGSKQVRRIPKDKLSGVPVPTGAGSGANQDE